MVREFGFPLERKLNHLFFLNLFVVVFVFFVTLYVCSRGLEFTDEGYYLQSIAYPDQFDYGVSQFGFFIHPFYNFFATNIVLLRAFNVLVTNFLSYYFCLQIFSSIFPSENRKRFFLYSLSFIFSISSLNIFSLAIFTPSHNSLNFQICILGLKNEKSFIELNFIRNFRKCILFYRSHIYSSLNGPTVSINYSCSFRMPDVNYSKLRFKFNFITIRIFSSITWSIRFFWRFFWFFIWIIIFWRLWRFYIILIWLI
jgi:hypothetical protein